MAKYGTWMLETLVLKYCDAGGSSRGMRAFMEDVLPKLKVDNAHLGVEEVLRRHRHPMIVGLFRNGRSKPICVKNMSVEEVQEQISWLRNSHGRGQEYKVVRVRQLSRNPSIQGAWSIDTFASQLREENARRLQDAAGQQQY